MDTGAHVEEILNRIPVDDPFDTLAGWYKSVGVTGRTDLEVHLLVLVASTQVVAAWALRGDEIESEEQYLAEFVAIANRVAIGIVESFYDQASTIKVGSVFKKSKFSDEQSFDGYVRQTIKEIWENYNDVLPIMPAFNDALGGALATHVMTANYPRCSSQQLQGVTSVALALGTDYIASFRDQGK